jgi:hypothetical protein
MSDGRSIQHKTPIDPTTGPRIGPRIGPKIGPRDPLQNQEAVDLMLIELTITTQLETITQTPRFIWPRSRHRKVILCLTDGL